MYIYIDMLSATEDDSDELPAGIVVLIIILCIIIVMLVGVTACASFMCYRRGLHSKTG